MEINEIKYGFRLVSIREAKDFDSTLYEYEHVKSGGKLVYVANEDTNCCFAIGFRTLPVDSTGVCHIIEHSVLCGSDKYPLKEPFVNLLKTSLATFLNAFTASDWTMYPFASQTPKDFDNILSIYLDAVFNPLSMKDEKPFLQEGWHLELLNEDDTPSYKGVVYNEMKGAMSSVDEVLRETTKQIMFDSNCTYHHNSGGDPDAIIDLTYEDYKAFHKKHYTPQNAMTYLYGKLDIEEKLKFIDENYFSYYEKGEDSIIINKPLKVINTTYTAEYEIGIEEDEKDNTYMELCYALDDASNYETLLAMQIVLDALLSKNDSVLKKALLDAKLGQNVSASVDDDCVIPCLYIELEKTNLNKKEEFKQLFEDEVRKLVKNGINKESLLASINSLEFSMKEMDTGRMAKGLIFAMNMMNSFNYRFDMITSLEFVKYFNKFRAELNNNYFENLLDRLILKSTHNVLSTVVPSKTLGERKKKAMDEKMLALKNSMSIEEKRALVKQTKELLAYQNHIDTKAELATLPELKLSDIPKTINYIGYKKTKVNGYNALVRNASTNNIAYLNMYFDASSLKLEDLPYVKVLLRLFKNVATKNYDVTTLNNLCKTYLGKLTFGMSAVAKSKDEVIPYVNISASSLVDNTNYINVLINEIILHSKFSKKETMQIIRQMANQCKQYIIEGGREVAIINARSHYSTQAVLQQYISNSLITLNFYNKLLESKDFKSLANKLKEVATKIFSKKNALVSISGNEATLIALKKSLKEIKLPKKEFEKKLDITLTPPTKEALVIPSGVSYSVLANNLSSFNEKYNGKYAVLSHIVNYDYLWPEVRVKGGAYGTGIMVNMATLDVCLTSYRDPNVKATYEVYRNLTNYLANFKCSKKEFTNYIIGAMGFDAPASIASLISTWDFNYLAGITKKDREDFKKQILKTKKSDIIAASEVFAKLLNENASEYTVGNGPKIEEYNFDNITNL